jgi:hypothetical protein
MNAIITSAPAGGGGGGARAQHAPAINPGTFLKCALLSCPCSPLLGGQQSMRGGRVQAMSKLCVCVWCTVVPFHGTVTRTTPVLMMVELLSRFLTLSRLRMCICYTVTDPYRAKGFL